LKLDNIKEWKIVSLLSLDKKNNQYALVHLIAVKLYDRYFLYVYQNLVESISIPNNFTTSSHIFVQKQTL
jgi:hypothetical protein